MSWLLYRWTWRLESPLFVGLAPAGSVNRCRLYVPARAMWGAVTAEIARANAASGFPEYDQVGEQLRKHARFTYLFPAEPVNGDWRAWLPCYLPGQGLVWEREDDRARRLSDREFRTCLLSTRPSTAIEASSDTAAEGSLRETECINTRWRGEDGRPGGPVALIGYVFLHDGLEREVHTTLENLKAIAIGGDTRYGFGQLRRWDAIVEAQTVFNREVDLDKNDPVVKSERALGHVAASCEVPGDLCGAMELLGGWDYEKREPWQVKDPLWVPGSCAESLRRWCIKDSGHWTCSEVA